MKNYNYNQLLKYLAENFVVRLEQWKDKSAWRVGLNWFTADDYEFVCEAETLPKAVRNAYRYATEEKTNPIKPLPSYPWQ